MLEQTRLLALDETDRIAPDIAIEGERDCKGATMAKRETSQASMVRLSKKNVPLSC